MNQIELINYCNHYLAIHQIDDFCPNGLQVEGDNREVKRIALGVSISLEFIEKAIEAKADLIITHHGMIWDKDSRVIQGPYKKKIEKLLRSGIAASSYHLPLDYHLEVGNNIQLGQILGLKDLETIPRESDKAEAVAGTPAQKSISDFSDHLSKKLGRDPLVLSFGPEEISKAVIITGGAQNYFSVAVKEGADCFITGEVSEKNYSLSQEYGIHFISAGHYATEQFGIQALGAHLEEKFGVDSCFLEIANPI